MIIKINTTALCAGYASNQHVFDFSSECVRAVQDSKPIGASAGKALDRGNLTTIREFSVEVISASLEAAEEYINTQEAAAMGASGAITFEAEPAATGDTATLSDAVLESVKLVQWNGVCTVWRYRIRGGVLTVA
jgi:hypothetical protein